MSLALFCFSDLHNDLGAARRLAGAALVANVDFLVSAGDLAVDGEHRREVYEAFAWAERPVLSVPGNHDREAGYRDQIATAGWTDLDGQVVEHAGYWLAGNGYAAGDAFYSGPDPARQLEDPRLTLLLSRLASVPRERLVIVTHLPPWGTLSARDRKFIDRGNDQLARWIREHQPAAVICGHVHHREPVVERFGATLVVNPGPYGFKLSLP
jgi:hypothetical protein